MLNHPALIGTTLALAILIGGGITGFGHTFFGAAMGANDAAAWLGFWGGIGGGAIGGALTVMAAAVAWQSVQPQLKEMRRQSASAARSTMLPVAEEIESEIALIETLARAIRDADDAFNEMATARDEDEIVFSDNLACDALRDLRTLRSQFRSIEAKNFGRNRSDRSRSRLINIIDRLYWALDIMEVVHSAVFTPPEHSRSVSKTEIQTAKRQSYRLVSLSTTALVAHRKHLGTTLSLTWRRIRTLEEEAIAH